jgi:ketosteroid isomerase-like protein
VSLEDLGNLGSFVGGTLVIVSLLYVAFQIRQNTLSLGAAAYQESVRAANELGSLLAVHPDLNALFLRGLVDLDSLDAENRGRVSHLFLIALRSWALNRELAAKSLLPPVFSDLYEASSLPFLRSPAGRAWWAEYESNFDPEFRDFVRGRVGSEIGAARAVAQTQPGSDLSTEAQSVAARFAAAWASPELDRFIALLHADVRLLQPVTKPVVGRAAAREEFAKLLAWLPDLRGTVDRTALDGDTLLIAWRLRFTLGRAPYELRIVDRIVVEGGLIREREAYYDSLALMLALLARPSSWLGYWRYRGYV